MEAHSSDYTSDKHRKQWPATLEAYAYKLIGNMLVSDIAMRDVKNVLEQETTATDGQTGKLWFVKTETAKRLLGRIKTVLDFATVNEYLCQLLQYRLKFKLHGMTYLTAHFCTATDRDSN